jgi:hypothetical protein
MHGRADALAIGVRALQVGLPVGFPVLQPDVDGSKAARSFVDSAASTPPAYLAEGVVVLLTVDVARLLSRSKRLDEEAGAGMSNDASSCVLSIRGPLISAGEVWRGRLKAPRPSTL